MGQVRFDFSTDVFVVTGASSGMGRDISLALAQAGAKILAIGRNEKRLAEVQAQVPDLIFPAQLDVCDSKTMEATIGAFVQKHGKLNGGVHAAGICGITPLRRGNTDSSRIIMETSFWAGMDFLRLVTKSTLSVQKTSTVLISSVCAHSHEKGMFAYTAAKAALESGMKAAAKEISLKGHRVNAIIPGWVQSSMANQLSELSDTESVCSKHPLGVGVPEDITEMVLFLLSDASRWMTGSSVVMDGGYLA